MSITEAQAEIAIAAAIREAAAIGVPMNIAVYDDGAKLKAFRRMDGALLGSVDIALNKARTAALFGLNTEILYEFAKPGGTSPGFERTNGGLIVFAGGIPLHDADGQLIGAVGVSGGSVAQDYQVAEAAARAVAPARVEEFERWAATTSDGQEGSTSHSLEPAS
jgi:uncharacterized protein GlcG (DUF336 family)